MVQTRLGPGDDSVLGKESTLCQRFRVEETKADHAAFIQLRNVSIRI